MMPDKIESASSQLDRVLGFFPRIEAKASFLFAVNTGLLATTALNLRASDLGAWYVGVPGAIAVVLIACSLVLVYLSLHPKLAGGSNSLIYFRQIADLREAEFVEKFTALDEVTLANDILGQVWRNSEILKAKYDYIERAYVLTAVATLPWFIFLVMASVTHAGTPVFR